MTRALAAPCFTVVGNPGSRRVELFARAARAAGCPEPEVLPWRELLADDSRPVLPEGALVRIDSPGEDEGVDRMLRGQALGSSWAPTRVEGGAAWHRSFSTALRRLAVLAAATPGATLLGDVTEIGDMFDKRRSHALLSAAGVPVPPALSQGGPQDPQAPDVRGTEPVSGWQDLRERLLAAGFTRAFVKPAHGSSGSGVVALELGPRGQARATTSAALHRLPDGRVGLVNSLRMRRYSTEEELESLFGALAVDPLHIERWIPKATQHGRSADLRVLVTAGQATHAVLRTSRQPMTNLHLGGSRGDLALLRATVGPDAWRGLLDVCEQAAGCFPRSLSVGVDLLGTAGWRRCYVGEVNAFGDLLPNLPGLTGGPAEGRDTYAAFVDAALARVPDHA